MSSVEASTEVRLASVGSLIDVMVFHVYRQGEELELQVEIGSKTESALKDQEPQEAEGETQQNPYGDQGQPGQNPGKGQENWGQNPLEEFFRFYFGY